MPTVQAGSIEPVALTPTCSGSRFRRSRNFFVQILGTLLCIHRGTSWCFLSFLIIRCWSSMVSKCSLSKGTLLPELYSVYLLGFFSLMRNCYLSSSFSYRWPSIVPPLSSFLPLQMAYYRTHYLIFLLL